MIPPLPTDSNIYKGFLQDSYVSGIITSFLVLAVVEFWGFCKRVLVKRRFKAIFSKKDTRLNLVVPGYSVRSEYIDLAKINNLSHPEYPLIKQSDNFYSSSKLIGNTDVKSLKYLSDEISNRLNYSPQLWLDDDLAKSLDLDFIAFGGSNFYCKQMIRSDENAFFSLGDSSIKSKISGEDFRSDDQFDYGIIIKLKYPNFPDRIWIAIVGIGESGTSGSGWYLSKFWKKIQREAGSSEFAILIKVQHGIDHSARVVESYHRPGSIFKIYLNN